MAGNRTRNYFFIGIKVLCIMLILNLVFMIDFIDTSAAIDAFHKDQEYAENTDHIQDTANLDTEPLATAEPAEVVVEPREPDASIDNPVKDDKSDNSTKKDRNHMNLYDPFPGEEDSSGQENSGKGETINPDDYEHGEISEVFAQYQRQLDGVYKQNDHKTVYLTFDDGPVPSLTNQVLDILAEEEVKATFFVLGSNAQHYPDVIRRQYDEGHGIGNHTYSHVFKHIYANPKNFVDELVQTRHILQSILGEDKDLRLIRFPGGSFGAKHASYRHAANEEGFFYVDWNSLNGDAESSKIQSAEKLVARLKETVKNKTNLVVLMHDAPNKQTTIEALPEIIKYLKANGYKFELLPWSR